MRKTSLCHAALATITMTASALAQPTVIDYQGELKSAGVGASGPHDFRFRLYDSPTLGTQVGTVQCVNNVNVSGGRFTASVDFGRQFETSSPRYVEIEVRRDTGLDCTNSTGYTLLSPRQLVASAPRALAANVASALNIPNGLNASALVVDNEGRIGIGTASPTHSVHIAKPEPTLALQDTDSSGLSGGQQLGYISYLDSDNIERAWFGYGGTGDPDLSIINTRILGDIVLNPFGGGRVGIGTSSPLAALDVRGSIRLGSVGQHSAVAGEENLRIVKGTVSPLTDCTATPTTSGTGFTVSNLSCGEIHITFTPPFNGTPVVVASSNWDSTTGGKYVTCSNASSSGVSMKVFRSNGNNVRLAFEFMAVGPR